MLPMRPYQPRRLIMSLRPPERTPHDLQSRARPSTPMSLVQTPPARLGESAQGDGAGSLSQSQSRSAYVSHDMGLPSCPVSIICVFNDAAVREHCLDCSIERHRRRGRRSRLRPDRQSRRMHLMRRCRVQRRGIVSSPRSSRVRAPGRRPPLAAGRSSVWPRQLDRRSQHWARWSLGVERDGRLVGRVRDWVVLSASVRTDRRRRRPRRTAVHRPPPRLRRSTAVRSAGVRLARLRRRVRPPYPPAGLRVCAIDVPLTHNSLSRNFDDLGTAADGRARGHPDALPVRTPNELVTRSARRPPPRRASTHGCGRAGSGSRSRVRRASRARRPRLPAGRHPMVLSTTCSPAVPARC